MEFYSFSDQNLLNHDLADKIQQILCQAIALRGKAYLVVSGGKSPVAFFKLLAKKELPWDKVIITLADERCVASDDSSRNERLVVDLLLREKAHQARFISLYDEQSSLAENLRFVTAQIDALPTFDAVILGMGEDGHTASLFPCSDELASALDEQAQSVQVIHPKTAPHQRISLSKKRLLNSRMIFVYLIGDNKRTVLTQALINTDPQVMPISAFINNQNVTVKVMYAPR
ncbi:6-phosphogluconolactonase [Legionella worsleiensis]|uniref:6-phosphogluconolactonase n=1 Tax=Legionella worsleiensis TaxID=45076 RepID=A0A0W1AK44_9GAMM|nr:6-phosphogluconolactonase [Legionella worsleiensis]KTD81700.1 6-phosphogluconolactonase [Legionella worsleiensis]STY31890.1 6-phosphogluconolactonase [Legionella worsleiensis]